MEQIDQLKLNDDGNKQNVELNWKHGPVGEFMVLMQRADIIALTGVEGLRLRD